jgi:hypothetical protein
MEIINGFKIGKAERKRAVVNLIIVTILSIVGALAMYRYPVGKYGFYPECPFHYLTKAYCAGCGTLRGLSQTARGNLLGLARNNILALLFLPAILYGYADLISKSIFAFHLPVLQFSGKQLLFLAGIIILYGILRNFIPVLAPVS